MKTCRFCEHWVLLENSHESKYGFCHLNPPNQPTDYSELFPCSVGTDYCSYFKPWVHPEVVQMGKLWEQEYLHNYRSHKVMLDHKTHELDRWVI